MCQIQAHSLVLWVVDLVWLFDQTYDEEALIFRSKELTEIVTQTELAWRSKRIYLIHQLHIALIEGYRFEALSKEMVSFTKLLTCWQDVFIESMWSLWREYEWTLQDAMVLGDNLERLFATDLSVSQSVSLLVLSVSIPDARLARQYFKRASPHVAERIQQGNARDELDLLKRYVKRIDLEPKQILKDLLSLGVEANWCKLVMEQFTPIVLEISGRCRSIEIEEWQMLMTLIQISAGSKSEGSIIREKALHQVLLISVDYSGIIQDYPWGRDRDIATEQLMSLIEGCRRKLKIVAEQSGYKSGPIIDQYYRNWKTLLQRKIVEVRQLHQQSKGFQRKILKDNGKHSQVSLCLEVLHSPKLIPCLEVIQSLEEALKGLDAVAH